MSHDDRKRREHRAVIELVRNLYKTDSGFRSLLAYYVFQEIADTMSDRPYLVPGRLRIQLATPRDYRTGETEPPVIQLVEFSPDSSAGGGGLTCIHTVTPSLVRRAISNAAPDPGTLEWFDDLVATP